MSTKTSFKRVALVAVAALGMGVLTSVSPASATDGVVTGSVGPIRVTFVDTTRDAVPATTFSFTNTATALVDTATSAVLVVTKAPTTAAVVSYTMDSVTLTDRLLDAGSASADGAFGTAVTANEVNTGTLSLTTAAAAGSYEGYVKYTESDGNAHTLTVKWAFTTTGAPKTIGLTFAPATVPSAGTAVASTATLTVKDANSNLTQLTTGDTIALASSNATEIPTIGDTSVDASEIPAGTKDITVTPKNSAIAGAYTVTATPAGTLPAAGVAAATATITVAAVATQGAASLAVTSPTTDIFAEDATATAAITKLNPASVKGTVTVTGSGNTPNAPVAVAVAADIASATNVLKVNAVTVNEAAQAGTTTDATVYVTADATGKISFDVDLSGSTVANGDDVILTVGSPIVAAGSTYAKLTLTYETAALTFTTTPATSAKAVAKTGASVSIPVTAVDQYSNGYANHIVSASQTGTATGATTASTGSTVTIRTSIAGAATIVVPAPSSTFKGTSTLSVALKDPSGGSIGGATSSITVEYSDSGTATSITLTDSDSDASTLTSDNASTRAVVVAPAALTNGVAANTDNTVSFTVVTAGPTALAFTATATNGIRLFTTDPKNAVITAGKSEVTGTAGTTTVYAVPTKLGAGTITVASGGLTKVFTLTGKIHASAPKGQLVTLTAGTKTGSYTVKVTDIFGNPVAVDVNLAVTGAGYLSNGFKNITISTAAADGSNSFDVIASGTGTTSVVATIVSAGYTAVLATEATTQGLAGASAQTATLTVTPANGGAGIAELSLLVNSLIKKINALSILVAKIQKKLGVK